MRSEPMRTLTISLTPKQADRLQEAVESGDYASNSEIVRDALKLWEDREQRRTLETEYLKRAYAEGKASGDGRRLDPQALIRELKAEYSSRG